LQTIWPRLAPNLDPPNLCFPSSYNYRHEPQVPTCLFLIHWSLSQAPMAHVCNPIYSGGRDQEDLGLKPAWANTSRPYLKKTHYKNRQMEWLECRHWVQAPVLWKKKYTSHWNEGLPALVWIN
jgi:hypothetical protein